MGCGIFPSQGILEFKNNISHDDDNNVGNDIENIFQTDVELSSDYYWDMSFNEMFPASELNPSEKLKFKTLANEANGLFANNINEPASY
ncbi:unnamed protein product [Brachionus calyciflorus]|uniref:Uncharacterized protein n=1 Tax=Brachionus calyciflorus TaxID=104777 RepID=A0A813W3U5_9BILA|nr:unnamed protein product [Brachionus calyciflorus]